MRIRGRRHFSGRYDDAKGRILTLLAQYPQEWFSPQQIHEVTGVNFVKLRAQCGNCTVIRLNDRRQPPYLKGV